MPRSAVRYGHGLTSQVAERFVISKITSIENCTNDCGIVTQAEPTRPSRHPPATQFPDIVVIEAYNKIRFGLHA